MNMSINVLFLFIILFKGEVKKKKKGISKLIIVFPNNVIFNIN